MIVSFIVAAASNNVIGNQNQLPWHFPADLKHFKQVTTGHTVIMGRKTYESIGKPLPNRRNIVISTSVSQIEGCEVISSIKEALDLCTPDEEIFIIGGAKVFEELLDRTDRIYLTRIHHAFNGDAFFPEINFQNWTETDRKDFSADEKNPFDYSFITLNRN